MSPIWNPDTVRRAAGAVNCEYPGFSVVNGCLGPLRLIAIEVGLVVVITWHGDKATAIRRATDAEIERLGSAIGFHDQELSRTGAIDGDLVVTHAIIVAWFRNIARQTKRHGTGTDSAGDGPNSLAIDDGVNRGLIPAVGIEVTHHRSIEFGVPSTNDEGPLVDSSMNQVGELLGW